MRLVAIPGGSRQVFRAVFLTMPFDIQWGFAAVNLIFTITTFSIHRATEGPPQTILRATEEAAEGILRAGPEIDSGVLRHDSYLKP